MILKEKWKTRPYWIKGGIILAGLYTILFILFKVILLLSSPLIERSAMHFFTAFLSGFILSIIFIPVPTYFIFYDGLILLFIYGLVTYFIIGAIIGLIIGKINSKSRNTPI